MVGKAETLTKSRAAVESELTVLAPDPSSELYFDEGF